MFDAALPTVGFLPKAKKVRAYGGREWTLTGHDLDRVYARNGVHYGAEIKNTLEDIDKEELEIKLQMCHALALKPLFILRCATGHYVEPVRRAGGFTLIFKWQLYPHGFLSLAKRIHKELGLPVDSPEALQAQTPNRFLIWHLKQILKA